MHNHPHCDGLPHLRESGVPTIGEGSLRRDAAGRGDRRPWAVDKSPYRIPSLWKAGLDAVFRL
ncbi:hypothetical protein GCM10027601_38110 [Nocardioides ungokensis]